ncbi:MAG: hypothetical protein PHR07_09325 [Acidaminococcaceae bacterium]|nr:hypothetical protein [Acidaminococcaceae bacterium]
MMKRIILLFMCLLIAIPSLALANEKPRVGVVSLISYRQMYGDEDSKNLASQKMDELFSHANRLNRFEYIPSTVLRKSIMIFVDKEKIHSKQDLTTEKLVQFGKEQNLDYILLVDYDKDNLKVATTFMGISFDVSLGMTVKFVNVSTSEVAYMDHLSAMGKATSEVRAIRDAVPPLMQKFTEQFKQNELVK